ncbi:unnamed protein product [Prunus armeniaca]
MASPAAFVATRSQVAFATCARVTNPFVPSVSLKFVISLALANLFTVLRVPHPPLKVFSPSVVILRPFAGMHVTSSSDPNWYLDSGATNHMTHDASLLAITKFSSFHPNFSFQMSSQKGYQLIVLNVFFPNLSPPQCPACGEMLGSYHCCD